MKKAYFKSILREIKSTLNQFLAIFAIVALGVGFFAGLNGATPDMKATSDAYLDAYSLADFRLLSTMGFTQEDVDALSNLPYIERAEAGYAIDALLKCQEKTLAGLVISITEEGGLSQPVLVEGRLPQGADECVIDAMALKGQHYNFASIGDTITLTKENSQNTLDLFKTRGFTVVGVVDSPAYISFQRGTTTLAGGDLRCFIMVLPEVFSSDYYLELRATAKGSAQLTAFTDEYDNLTQSIEDSLQEFADERSQKRLEEITNEAQDTLNSKKQELLDARRKYEDGKKEYDSKKAEADQKIADAEEEIANGQAALDDGNEEIVASRRRLAQAQNEYDAQQEALNARLAEANTQIEALRTQAAQAQAAGQTAAAAELSARALAAQAALDQNPEIAAANSQLAAARAQIDDGYDALSAAEREAEDGAIRLEQSRADLEAAKKEADEKLTDAKKELDDAKNKIDDADEKLTDAQKELDGLEAPKWYVLPRDTNPGYAGFGADADRIAAISRVFPFFFFLVAALVCLTTMTRMVEEQRTQIGLLKALGYPRWEILAKYVLYAALAGVLGSAAGLIVGFNVFPRVIWKAYGMMYNLPPIIIRFHPEIAFASSGAAVGCIIAAAAAAAWGELKATPANLLRPKAPTPGRRVFLEKIPALWKRMSFMRKVSARNLFRYKKRFFMTVLGICGCTMLMLTAFGLRDSVSHIITRQFGTITKYDAVLSLDDANGPSTALESWFSQNNIGALKTMQSAITVEHGKISEKAYLLVPKDVNRLTDFINLQDRLTRQKVGAPNENGVVITEKIADKLGVTPGESITIKRGEQDRVEAVILGVTENYVFHYVYMAPALYQKLYGEAPSYGQVLINTGITDINAHEELISRALKTENVAGAVSQTKIAADYSDMMDSLNSVVWVLLLCANLLAFIVLYNLAVINITERTREIATVKVLGFTPRETAAYVFRENILLTAIGTGAGLVFGILLHKFVILTAEVDVVMFDRAITVQSFIYAGALTFAFAFAINALMRIKLSKINPAESLKSAE